MANIDYLLSDVNNINGIGSKTAKLLRTPKFSEVPFPVVMEPNLVIEYYSR